MTGGNITLLNDVPGNLQLAGGTVLLGPAFQNGGAITNLTLQGSSLSGTNQVTGTLNWNGGGLGSLVTIETGGTMNIVGAGFHDMPGAQLINHGLVVWI